MKATHQSSDVGLSIKSRCFSDNPQAAHKSCRGDVHSFDFFFMLFFVLSFLFLQIKSNYKIIYKYDCGI